MPTVLSCEGKNFDCVNGFEGEVYSNDNTYDAE